MLVSFVGFAVNLPAIVPLAQAIPDDRIAALLTSSLQFLACPPLSLICVRHPVGVSGRFWPRRGRSDPQALGRWSVAPNPSPRPRRSRHPVRSYVLPTLPSGVGSARPAKEPSSSNVSEES